MLFSFNNVSYSIDRLKVGVASGRGMFLNHPLVLSGTYIGAVTIVWLYVVKGTLSLFNNVLNLLSLVSYDHEVVV